MLSHAEIDARVEEIIWDTADTYWADARIHNKIQAILKQMSERVPYWRTELLPLESRTGTATSTTSNALVDATESQFVSTDADKVIYNSTDRTWAIVTAYVSTSQLTLSKDIMASGESYMMFNRYVNNPVNGQKQVDISQVDDWLTQFSQSLVVEYHLGYQRNAKVFNANRTLEIAYDGGIDDTDTGNTDAERNCLVYLPTIHRLPNLTDYEGTVNNAGGYAVGAVSMAVSGFSGTEIIPQHALFSIASVRGIYRVTTSLTLSGGGGTLAFYPGLLDAAVNTDVITIVSSTLTNALEEILIKWTAGELLSDYAIKMLPLVPKGAKHTDYTQKGELMIAQAKQDLRNLEIPDSYVRHSRS